MSTELIPPVVREDAYVLFMDLVGFSLLPLQEQPLRVGELQNLVRQVEAFQTAAAAGNLIRLPTGDGIALVFFRDPAAPVNCALQLAEALRRLPHLRIRMGLHSGPVYRVEDINANLNVSGAGINLAQRVMDCGDAGHILISGTFAEHLLESGEWPVHDMGECEVKHSIRLHLFNLHTDTLGNPSLPMALRASGRARSPARLRREVASPRIAILSRPGAEPDGQVAALLKSSLRAEGCQVFSDHELPVSLDWGLALQEQIAGADVVIPLLSSASSLSDVLELEVRWARRAAQERYGKPRLLPVRLNYTGPLPPALADLLDAVKDVVWMGSDDDEWLVAELLSAMRGLETPPPPLSPGRLQGVWPWAGQYQGVATPSTGPSGRRREQIDGAVPIDSGFYIERPADRELRIAIGRREGIILLTGARQVGKTSLLARTLKDAREGGSRVAFFDFQKADVHHLESSTALFMALAESVADQLGLGVLPEWLRSSQRSPGASFEQYLRSEVLAHLGGPFVWCMDGVDLLFTRPGGGELFGLAQSWDEERSLDPFGRWSRVTVVMSCAVEPAHFFRDSGSPFTAGTRFTLEDFTAGQVSELNSRHGSPLECPEALDRFHRLLSGHPYLVRRALQELGRAGLDLDLFEAQSHRDDGIFGDHLSRMLALLASEQELLPAVREAVEGHPCSDPLLFYRLKSAGILAGDGPAEARLRCSVYQKYLSRHLL